MEKPIDKQQVKRARITGIVLAFSMIITLLSIVYAFTLKQQVDRISKEAEEVKVLAEKHRLEAEEAAAEANMKLFDALKALNECVANAK
jgi:cell division protein FtsB